MILCSHGRCKTYERHTLAEQDTQSITISVQTVHNLQCFLRLKQSNHAAAKGNDDVERVVNPTIVGFIVLFCIHIILLLICE